MDRKSEAQEREKIKELDRLTKERIKSAFTAFCIHPSVQGVYAMCDEILFGYMFNTICYVPVNPGKDGIALKKAYCKERSGNVYILFTEMEEAEDKEQVYVCLPYRRIIQAAAVDEDIVGIYVNPNTKNPLMLITKQNIQVIIQTGDEKISQYQPDFAEALEKYQVVDLHCGPGGSELSDRKIGRER